MQKNGEVKVDTGNYRPIWIVEDVHNKVDTLRLIDACIKNSVKFTVLTVEEILTLSNTHVSILKKNPVIFYGSLHFCRVAEKYDLIPGIQIDYEATKCHKYLPTIRARTIHTKYGFHTLDQLIYNSDMLFEMYGDEIFIKPNISTKAFSGQVITKENIDSLIHEVIHLNDDTLCLLSSANKNKTENEYRFFVTNNKIITATQYQPIIYPVVPDGAYDFVKQVQPFFFNLSNFKSPYEQIFSIDVCEMKDGSFKVVEIGGFNCAGLYDIDYDKLVEYNTELAIEEFKQYQNI